MMQIGDGQREKFQLILSPIRDWNPDAEYGRSLSYRSN